MIEVGIPISTEELLSAVPPIEIFRKYCTPFIGKDVNTMFFSEIRNEKTPSARIKISKYGIPYHKDYGNTIHPKLLCIDYVRVKFNMSYTDALQLIYQDFKSDITSTTIKERKSLIRSGVDLKIEVRKISWTKKYLSFWEQFGWTDELLYKNNIFPIDYFWLKRGDNNRAYESWFGFTYDLGMNVWMRRKIYRPHADSIYRFRTNNSGLLLEGVIPKTGDLLILTSSLKDAGVFQRLGYNSCAPNSESTLLFNDTYIDLSKRFTDIIVYFDNDEPGIEHAKEYYNNFGFKYFHNPLDAPKDPSDWVKEEGIDIFNKYLDKIIKI